MDAVAQLLARDQHGIKFGLDSIRTLSSALDHPERAWRSLIVAGTNGKGSVTAMVAEALAAAGHRTGRYTSPHLVHVEERFAIDGRPADPAQLREAITVVLDAEGRCLERGALSAPVTFFELATASAFELFRRARVDVVVLEVGMGGRFDATNAAEPLAGAITSIAFDHMRFLGDTLAAITFEKAGIIRPGVPVVVGPVPAEADQVIRAVAREHGAPVIDAYESVRAHATLDDRGRTRLAVRTPDQDYGMVTLALRGRHQVTNAVVAVRLLETAARAGLHVPPDAIRDGLSRAFWPARLQEVALPGGRSVLLDAAHNPAGAATLAAYLEDVGRGPMPVVFGAMSDKDVTGMLRVLAPHASVFVFTQAHSARAMSAAQLAAAASQLELSVPHVTVADPRAALGTAFERAPRVVVAGSIFLIGDLMASLPGALESATVS